MLFSIITICLNPGPLLDETIRSLAVQREAQWEHLIIDGGSSDGTVERLEKAAADDDRVRWISEPDSGIADAMNKGLEMAKGEIIAFLHADDRYAHENVLADVAACFSAHGSEAGWVTGGMREIDLHGKLLRTLPVRRFSYRRLLRNNIIMHPATFVRCGAFQASGNFDDVLTYAMDYDLWLRLGKISPPLLLDDILTDFRVHVGSLSSRESLKALEESYRIRKKYVQGSLALLGHALYYYWQYLNEKLSSSRLRQNNV